MLGKRIKGLFLGFGLLLGVFSPITAQQPDVQKCLLITNQTFVGLSALNLYDGYISNLPYEGFSLQFRNISRQFLNVHNEALSIRSDLNLSVGVTSNVPSTAFMDYMACNFGIGLQQHLKPFRKFQLLIGGLCDVDMCMRVSSRDVNNGGNGDLSANLNLIATLRYDFSLWKKPFRLQADFRSPLVGYMLVPQLGESYYEIFVLENYADVGHFTSLHNKNALNASCMLQIPFKRMVWNLGVCSDNLKYEANQVKVRRNAFSIQIGATYDFHLFGGRKNQAPAEFVSSEW